MEEKDLKKRILIKIQISAGMGLSEFDINDIIGAYYLKNESNISIKKISDYISELEKEDLIKKSGFKGFGISEGKPDWENLPQGFYLTKKGEDYIKEE